MSEEDETKRRIRYKVGRIDDELPNEAHLLTRRRVLVALGALAVQPTLRAAPTYPARPVTIIVSFPAGGIADTQMRGLAQAAERFLGQSIIVENKPGALGLLGANAIARAQPDGYTLLQATQNIYRAPFLGKVLYDPLQLTYIIGFADNDHALFVAAGSRFKSLQDLIATAKQKPGDINIGTTGVASTGHLLLQDVSTKTGAKFNHVPFKGAPELATGLIGGHIDAAFMPFYEGYKMGDKLRMLALFGTSRVPELPNVPTAKEQGVDSGIRATYGLVGPKGLPPAIVAKLHDAFLAASKTPEYQALLKRQGMIPWYHDSASYAAYAQQAVQREMQLVEQAGLTNSN